MNKTTLAVNQTVYPLVGPHKNQAHQVIWVHEDGSVNIVLIHSYRNQKDHYRHGAVRATPDQMSVTRPVY
jgi:hypothetical protein